MGDSRDPGDGKVAQSHPPLPPKRKGTGRPIYLYSIFFRFDFVWERLKTQGRLVHYSLCLFLGNHHFLRNLEAFYDAKVERFRAAVVCPSIVQDWQFSFFLPRKVSRKHRET